MPKKLKIYVGVIILLGISFIIYTFNRAISIDTFGLIFFLFLSVAAESLAIPTPNQRGLSVGFAVGFTAILVFGVSAASWIASVGIMLRVVEKDEKYIHPFNTPIYKTLFNGANIALSSGLAGLSYEALGGIPGQLELSNILPMIICIVVYIIVNNTIMSILMTIISGDNLFKYLYTNVVWVVKDYFAIAPLGIIMAIAYISYGIIGVVLFFGPLLLARYSFKMYVDMRKMYLDTVKALCQAVEAKDPYTQGHSQRVSELAYQLGKRMGLPHIILENLKLAGMLHDIGKIGVDEHILNKPGRLSDDEYDKIKLHPAIGWKIIKEVNFLKESANIILSHHERFNGTGYPNGICKDEIPIEAYILSIADVYDALTSDRPYRKAMDISNAISIIKQEIGTSFNPRVADEFIKMLEQEREAGKLVDRKHGEQLAGRQA